DVRCLLDFLGAQAHLNRERISVVGLGQAGAVALCVAALEPESVYAAAAVSAPASFLTSQAYPPGTRMGLLAPGIVRVGDISLLAALVAPRRLVIADAVGPDGKPLADKPLGDAFAVTRRIYRL